MTPTSSNSAAMPSAVLAALTKAAVEATAAGQGWLLVLEDHRLRVVAAHGGDPRALMGATVAADTGSAGFVVASGRPLAIACHDDDVQTAQGVAGLLARPPTSVLAAPCGTDHEVVGVLELVDKAGGAPFDIDDVELVALLADIAGAALAEPGLTGPGVPGPAQLNAQLTHLAGADPGAYATVARVVAALLDRG